MMEMLSRLLVAACLCLWAALAQAGSTTSLESAQRAVNELRWADARANVEAVLRAGGLDREAVLRAYELRAEATAVLDGADAGEREYRKLLSLDPTHAPPRRRSPVFMVPYERARRWATAENGALRLAHTPPEALPAGVPTTLAVELNDPLSLAGAVRAVGTAGETPFSLEPPRLPKLAAGARATYRLEAIDGTGNVLVTLGADTPFSATAVAISLPPVVATPTPTSVEPTIAAARTRRPRLWRPAIGVAAFALASAGVALGLDLGARAEFRSLQQRCAPHCRGADLATLHGEEAGAIAGYTIAGASAAAAAVLLIVDRLRR
jgi:hypothetical protein